MVPSLSRLLASDLEESVRQARPEIEPRGGKRGNVTEDRLLELEGDDGAGSRRPTASLGAMRRAARIEPWSWDIASNRVFLGDSESPASGPHFESPGSVPHPVPTELELDDFLSRLNQQDAVRLRARLEHAKASGDVLMESFSWSRDDGQNLHFQITAEPVINDEGAVIGFEGALQDQTRQREQESRLLASRKLEAIGHMASGVCHDFNNVFSVIKGFTDLIRDDMDPNHPVQADLIEIQGATEQGRRLLKQLTLFAPRDGRGKETLELHELLEERRLLLQQTLRPGVSLTLSPDAQVSRLKFHPSRLEQLVLNLIDNAGDAVGETGQVALSTRNLTVDVATECSDGGRLEPGLYLCVSVSDSGPGLGEERSRIFEPFFSTRRKGKGKGTGLGLSVCSYLAQEAGGGIDVSSTPQGSTFEVYLRVAAEVAEDELAG